jgi:hypothetical protein
MAGRCLLVSVTACVGASLLAACGGGGPDRATTRHDRVAAARSSADPASARANLRSPDVDGRMDPVSSATVFACPHTGRVEVFFDPRGTVALVANGRPLVYGTAGTRAVSRRCRSRGRRHGVPKGVLSERTEVTTLTCAVPRSARFEVHPNTVSGAEVGTTVALLAADLRRIVLSVVLEVGGSRIYPGRTCRTG